MQSRNRGCQSSTDGCTAPEPGRGLPQQRTLRSCPASSHVPDPRPKRQHTPPRGPPAEPSVRRASAERPACRQQRHVTRRISLRKKKKKKCMYVIESPPTPPSPVRLRCPLSRWPGSAPGLHALLLRPGRPSPSPRCHQPRTYRRGRAVPRPPRRARGSGRWHPPGRPPPRTPRWVPALARCGRHRLNRTL